MWVHQKDVAKGKEMDNRTGETQGQSGSYNIWRLWKETSSQPGSSSGVAKEAVPRWLWDNWVTLREIWAQGVRSPPVSPREDWRWKAMEAGGKEVGYQTTGPPFGSTGQDRTVPRTETVLYRKDGMASKQNARGGNTQHDRCRRNPKRLPNIQDPMPAGWPRTC
jgi:hypothetical protein